MLVERRLKIVTEQHVIDKPADVEGFPIREWSVKLFILDDDDNECESTVFNKVVYKLHPSFPKPVQTFLKPPFACVNEGWGEFEMEIDMYTTEKGKITVTHDVNFQTERYEIVQSIQFKNPSQTLQERLRETGLLPSDGPVRKKANAGALPSADAGILPANGVTSRKIHFKYDFEKIAEALECLEEDDLLRVIQMINDGRSADTYIKSDLDAGEFSIDLYTMPEALTRDLWDHLSKMGLVS